MTLDDQQTAALDTLADDLEKRRDDLTDTERAFLVAWGGTWERDETDEADDQHSERADQEAWT
jgi:cation transport regulator ChaB